MEHNREEPEKQEFLGNEANNYEIKVYGKRWVILCIFMYYACINSFQWIEYCAITHIVIKYYKVSTLAVDWTSIIYMAVYPPMVIPASMIIDKKGLRVAGIIGCLGTVLGTAIKVLSIRSDLFFVVLIGQAIVSAAQVVIVSLPPKIASTWFQANEVSTACSVGVFGTLFGVALGYVVPPMIVKDSEDFNEIGAGLQMMCWALTIAAIPAAVSVLFYFPKEPVLPPSLAQAHLRGTKEEFSTKAFFISIQKLFINKAFIIFALAYSINIAVSSAFGTLLTQYINNYFENAHEDAGRMGFVMVLSGTVGSIFFGVLLDKTHKYKATTLVICLLTAVSVLGLVYALEWRSMVWSYIMCALVGIFTSAYLPVGVELLMEVTFPSEESTTTGIMFSLTQVLSVLFTVAVGYLNFWIGCYWTLITQVVFLFVGSAVTACIPNVMRRQEAFKEQKNVNILRRASYQGSKLLSIK